MSADDAIYRSARMAAAYAFTRPPVHAQLVGRIATRLAPGFRVGDALDIGCGAGASTTALAPIAGRVVGLERHAIMLTHMRAAAAGAAFVVGRAEALPFPAGTFDLVTAAGALNYTDVGSTLAQVARVMRDGGLFVPYDFSEGEGAWGRARDEFRRRYPSPPGYFLDLRSLNYAAHGLELVGHEALDVDIPMRLEDYVDYLMGESRVEHAVAAGRLEGDIRRECESALRPFFDAGPRSIIFGAQMVYVRK